MAYNTEELKKQAIEEITSKKLIFHTDVFQSIGISSPTYYEHFPSESSDYKDIDTLLRQNRTNMKNGLRAKWYKSDNATMTVALYKLLADDDERKKLSQQFTDVTSNGETVGATIVFEDKPTE